MIKAKEAEIKEKNLEIKQCFEDNDIKRKEKDDNHENAELSQIITELRDKVKTMKEENETLRDQIAVSDMLHEDFKERMRDKYLYNTDDTERDYESNEEIREKRREISRKRKIEKRRKKVECNLCDFKAKNHETYNRTARVLCSNKCLSQVIFNKSQTNLNRVLISVNLKLIQCISHYLSLCHNFGLSGSIIKYLLSSINHQILNIK